MDGRVWLGWMELTRGTAKSPNPTGNWGGEEGAAFDCKPRFRKDPVFLFPLGHRKAFSLVHVCKHLLSPNHGSGSALGTRDVETDNTVGIV